MIEPAELTINDLVKVDQTTETVTARVLGVHKDGVINYEVDYSGVRATNITHADYVSPIKLTEDVLVKNGFQLESKIEDDCLTYKCGNFHLFYYPDGTGLYSYNSQIVIGSVHQLQHLLRLCGIEKELIID